MKNIRRSPDSKTPRHSRRGGFTLVEIMVCIGIFALLCTLALPGIQSYLVKSRGTTCANRLQIIEAAKKAWAFDHSGQAMPADPLAANGLADYLPGRTVPVCPAGGVYSNVTTLGTRCACSANTPYTVSTKSAQASRSSTDPDIGGPDWAHNGYHDLGPE